MTDIPINADCPRCDCRTLWLVSVSKAQCRACGETFGADEMIQRADETVKAVAEAQSQMHGQLRREQQAKAARELAAGLPEA